MKKLLLGTTALVLLSGAAAAQQVTTSSPFTVTLGGSVRSDFSFFDEDVSNVNREQRLDTRLTLGAEAKADNGLVYGFNGRIRTSGDGGNGMIMDYKYLYAKGAWGAVNLGDYQGAATQLEVVAPTVGIGQADYAAFTGAGFASLFWATEDQADTRITYITPSFSGFQAGLSYTPEKGDSGRGIQKTGARYRDIAEVAAQYSGEFGGVGVTVGGGFELGGESTSALGDYQVWNLGAQVSYAGFSFGGNYYDNGETGLGQGADQYGWALGLTYATGPFGVGASYVRTTTDLAGSSKVDDQIWGVGGAYKLAPGLSLQADVNYINSDDADTDTAGNQDNKAWQLVLRTRVDF
jgi:hypothetical protein